MTEKKILGIKYRESSGLDTPGIKIVIYYEIGIKKWSKCLISQWIETWVLDLSLLHELKRQENEICTVRYWRTKAKELGNAAGRKKKVSKVS